MRYEKVIETTGSRKTTRRRAAIPSAGTRETARAFIRICAVVAAVAAITAVAASGAATPIRLNLKDGYANRTLVACGIRHHYKFFHAGRLMRMDGTVQPPPRTPGWRVKVKVKKCIAGRFRAVWSGHARGNANGAFKIEYRPRRKGSYFARAYYYGVRPTAKSDKKYFRVR